MNLRVTRLMLLAVVSFGLAYWIALSSISSAADGDNHQHPTQGPHGGSLIELGEEEYHAEILHDDVQGTVTVYLLDAAVRRFVAVQQPEVVINVRHGKQGQQFRLKAKPQKNDRQGSTSRFETKSANLVEMLDDHHSVAQLAVKIGSRSYTGRIVHNHDHDHADHHGHSH